MVTWQVAPNASAVLPAATLTWLAAMKLQTALHVTLAATEAHTARLVSVLAHVLQVGTPPARLRLVRVLLTALHAHRACILIGSVLAACQIALSVQPAGMWISVAEMRLLTALRAMLAGTEPREHSQACAPATVHSVGSPRVRLLLVLLRLTA